MQVKGSILQYFLPSLSYHLSLRAFFCLFLSGRLRQVLLYFGFLLGWEAAATSASSIDNEATARIKLLQLVVIHAVTKEGEPLIIILYNYKHIVCVVYCFLTVSVTQDQLSKKHSA